MRQAFVESGARHTRHLRTCIQHYRRGPAATLVSRPQGAPPQDPVDRSARSRQFAVQERRRKSHRVHIHRAMDNGANQPARQARMHQSRLRTLLDTRPHCLRTAQVPAGHRPSTSSIPDSSDLAISVKTVYGPEGVVLSSAYRRRMEGQSCRRAFLRKPSEDEHWLGYDTGTVDFEWQKSA